MFHPDPYLCADKVRCGVLNLGLDGAPILKKTLGYDGAPPWMLQNLICV